MSATKKSLQSPLIDGHGMTEAGLKQYAASLMGKIGGKARAAALSPERRSEIGKMGQIAGLAVRRANAAAKKAAREAEEKEADGTPTT